MPRPTFVDTDQMTPLQAQRTAAVVLDTQQLYSTLSLRRQQQLAETIGLLSPAVFPEPHGRPSSRASLEPLLRTPEMSGGRLSPLRASTPSPAFLSFRATDDDIVDDARLNAARIKELEAELKASRMETERALDNHAEIKARGDRLSAAYRAERATHAAERIADATYDAQQDRVDALAKAAVAQRRRAAAMHKNVGLRQRIGDVIGATSEPLEAELRRYHGADSWMEEEEEEEDEDATPIDEYRSAGWQLHYPRQRESRGEPLTETRQHAEDFLRKHPQYDQLVSEADLMAARVYTMETSLYRERLNLACRQMDDWRFIDSDVDNPPPQFGHMYFHLKRAVTALKGAKNEARFYRREAGFYDRREDSGCEVGKVVTWHEFKTVTNASKLAEALLLATSGGGGGADAEPMTGPVGNTSNNGGGGGVLYRIEPSAGCGHHFGNLGACSFYFPLPPPPLPTDDLQPVCCRGTLFARDVAFNMSHSQPPRWHALCGVCSLEQARTSARRIRSPSRRAQIRTP